MKLRFLPPWLLIALLAGPAFAQPINTLPNASTPLTGTEGIVATQSGAAVQLTPAEINAILLAATNTWTAVQTYPAPTTSAGSIVLTPGASPTGTPPNGALWVGSQALNAQINGFTNKIWPSALPTVMTYGAKGDCVTDDHAAFIAAEAAGAVSVPVPPGGCYLFNAGLGTVSPGMTYVGAGRKDVLLKKNFNGTFAVLNDGVQISGLTINGEGTTGDLLQIPAIQGNQKLLNMRAINSMGIAIHFMSLGTGVEAGSLFYANDVQAYQTTGGTGQAVITGSSISGTTLTVGSVVSGAVAIGQMVQGAGITDGTIYIASGSGSTWTLNASPGTIGSEQMQLGSFAVLWPDVTNPSSATTTWVNYQSGGLESFAFGGADDTLVLGGTFAPPLWSTNTRHTSITSVRIDNALDNTMLVQGAGTLIMNSDIYAQTTIGANSTGIVLGPNIYNLGTVDAAGTTSNQNLIFDATAYTWTPTIAFGGTPWTQGNGSVVAEFSNEGTDVYFNIRIIVGSTSTIPSGALTITGPSLADGAMPLQTMFQGKIQVVGPTLFGVQGDVTNGTNVIEVTRDGNPVTDTTPNTIANGTVIWFSGRYRK